MSARRFLVALASFLLVSLVLPNAASAQSAQELFDQGMRAYRDGDYETARTRFREVVRMEPNQQDAIELYFRSQDSLIELMVEGGEFETFAKEILAKTSAAGKDALRDPEAAAEAAQRCLSGDFPSRQRAIFELGNAYGPFGVPPLVKVLAGNNEDDRLHAIYALSRLGRDATAPLLTATYSDNAKVREGAVQALMQLDDPRAMARLADLAASDSEGNIRSMAAAGSNGMDAGTAQYEQGLAFFRFDLERGMVGVENHGVVWSIEGGNLTAHDVPRSVVPMELAKDALLRAVELGNSQANSALAGVYAAQIAAMDSAIADGNEDLVERRSKLSWAALTLPQDAIDTALSDALRSRDVPTAQALIGLLNGAGLTAMAGLQEAVRSDVPSLRYQAALALADTGDTSGDVVTGLAEAVGVEALRIVHVVDNNDARRAQLVAELGAKGIVVLEGMDGADALVNARRAVYADAVVLADPLPDFYARRIVQELRRDDHFSEVPMFVYDSGETGDIDNVEVVESLTADTVIEAMGPWGTEREGYVATAAAAAWMLYGIAWSNPNVASSVALDLGKAISREDEVSINVMNALRHVGLADQIGSLSTVVGDIERSPEARAAAAGAVAGILSRNPGQPVDLGAFERALTAGNADLARAAARVLGLAGGSHMAASVAPEG